MADLQKIIEIVFTATDQVSGTITGVGKGIDAVASDVQSATQPLADFTEGILKADAALLGLGAAMTAYSITQAGQFKDATNEVYTLLQITPQAFGEFEKSILEYSRNSTSSIEDINAAVYTAISAGVDYKDTLEFLTEAEKASVAGRANLNESTKLLASTLNAYGADVQDVAEYSDALFTAVRLGQTTFPELAANLSKVSPNAAQLGIDIQTLAGAIATITKQGTSTDQAVTQINAALTALIKPSKEASDLAAQLGIEFGAQAVKAKGLETVLFGAAKATAGNEEAMARLFGSTEAVKGVLQLTAQEGKVFTSVLREMELSTGATNDAYQKMANNFARINQNVVNNLQATLVQAGTPLLEQYGDTAKALAEVFKSVGVAIDANSFAPVFAVLNEFGEKAEETLLQVAENLPEALAGVEWSGFVDSIEDLGRAFLDVFKGVDLTTAEGLKKALQGIVDSGETLIRTTTGIVEGLAPFILQLAETAKYINELSPEIKEAAGNVLGFATGLNKAAGLIAPLGAAIGGFKLFEMAKAMGGVELSTKRLLPLLGNLGLAAAFGNLVFEAGKFLELNDRIWPGVDSLGTAIYDLLNKDELKDLPQTFQQSSTGADALATSLETAAEATEKHSNAIAKTGEGFKTAAEFELAFLTAIEEEEANIAAADAALEKKDATTQTYGTTIDEATGKVIGFYQTGPAFVDNETKKQSALDDSIKKSKEYALKMEELASNERIKMIEATVTLNVAEIENETRRIESAFETMQVGIESTGKAIGELTSSLLEADSWWERSTIEDQLKLENEYRKQQFELQKAETEATLANLKAKTARLQKGDALIKIDATDLYHETQTFMWAMLKAIRIKANEESADFLLGLT